MKSPLSRPTLAGFAILAFFGHTAHAQIITLTGGDPSGGLTLNSANVIDALYSSNNATTQAWQGVTFSYTNANITRAGGGYLSANSAGVETVTSAGFTDTVADTQDTDLLNLMNAGLEYNGSVTPDALTLTIKNLTVGASYQIDTLISLDGWSAGGRKVELAYNTGPVVETLTPTSTTGIYDVEDIVQANSSGQIVVNFSGVGAGPYYNALVVSAAPEPGTWALIMAGIGALAVVFRVRARTA